MVMALSLSSPLEHKDAAMAVFVPFRHFKGALLTTLGQGAGRKDRPVPTATWSAGQDHRPVCGWKVEPPKKK